jgi:hypothetical protein
MSTTVILRTGQHEEQSIGCVILVSGSDFATSKNALLSIAEIMSTTAVNRRNRLFRSACCTNQTSRFCPDCGQHIPIVVNVVTFNDIAHFTEELICGNVDSVGSLWDAFYTAGWELLAPPTGNIIHVADRAAHVLGSLLGVYDDEFDYENWSYVDSVMS